MTTSTLLVATWTDGLFRVAGTDVRQELAGRSVRSLVSDGRGNVLAIVDGHALCRRSGDGTWTELAHSDADLSCCVPMGEHVYLGTDDARILRVDADGTQHWLTGFDTVAGRETWYAGSMIVDGRRMGPPLGIRSMTATCDGAVLHANVHVGGIPRSTDGGRTWQPTIDVEADVHQVCAHPSRPELVIAASAIGLSISRDAGATWAIESDGLHAPHCSAVAFGRNAMYVSASVDPFSAQGAVYRRAIDGDGPLQPVADGGFPRWVEGRVDTDCIASRDATLVVVDGSGLVYLSQNDGVEWACPVERLPMPSGVLVRRHPRDCA